jgi:adenosylcobinamide kinase/adenosylcobinamide-phosphate guanylyltransferase
MTGALHFITGGQRSGKSRHAERLALAWLAQASDHRAVVIATALASDDEMHQRIERHQRDRPEGFETVEEPLELGRAVRVLAAPHRLVLIDCLTLWLTNVLMPHDAVELTEQQIDSALALARFELLSALQHCSAMGAPVLLVSNEIGNGVIPMGAQVRQFVDELGRLNQAVVQCCDQITWMVAGQPFTQAVERWS